MLHLEGTLVAGDAMHTQRTASRLIIGKGGHYVLAQKEMLSYRPVDCGHGCIETRTATVSHDIGWLQDLLQWPALEAVRNHWVIENSLHWVQDVQMGEDDLRNRAGHGAENLAAVPRIALNIIRLMDDKLSIRRRFRWAAQKPEYRLELIRRAAELAPEL